MDTPHSMISVLDVSNNDVFHSDDMIDKSGSPVRKNGSAFNDIASRRHSNKNTKSAVFRHQRFNSQTIPTLSVLESAELNSAPILDMPPPRTESTFLGSPSLRPVSWSGTNDFLADEHVPNLVPPPINFDRSGRSSPRPPSRSGSPLPSANGSGPFDFQPVFIGSPSPSVKHAGPSQRKGHRYKHSSVSLNFFQEPPQRAPLPIPKSLPIPTLMECVQSMSKDQKIRAVWCGFHFFICYLVYNCDMPFTALSALAHLLLYDAVGAALCVVVDVLSNFDAWKQSSLHHPFGLERIEVLAGYALAVSLLFMGGDMFSHCLQDMIQSLYAAPGEHIHSHGKHIHNHANEQLADYHDTLSWFSMVSRVSLAIVVTLVSAIGLDNHSRINKTLRRASGDHAGPVWPFIGKSRFSSDILGNPCHFMTLTFSVGLLLFPLLGASGYRFVDTLLTPAISVSMCYMGWNLAKALAGMLVMSYPGEDHIGEIEKIIRRTFPLVESIEHTSLWQVHHGLWLASMNVVMAGTDEDEQDLRQQVPKIIKKIMHETIDDCMWQTTIDITRTTLVD